MTKKAMLEVLELAMKISTETTTDVTIDYNGACDAICCSIYLGGLVENKKSDYFYFSQGELIELEAVKNHLVYIYAYHKNFNNPVGNCGFCDKKLYAESDYKQLGNGKICLDCAPKAREALEDK